MEVKKYEIDEEEFNYYKKEFLSYFMIYINNFHENIDNPRLNKFIKETFNDIEFKKEMSDIMQSLYVKYAIKNGTDIVISKSKILDLSKD